MLLRLLRSLLPSPLLPYSLLWALVLPAALLRLLWRALRQPAYLQHVGERLGRYPLPSPGPSLWVHAVSVGETRAAEPLIRALLVAWPEHTLVLTQMTPTGRETAEALFGDEPRVRCAYLPYDLGPFVQRFVRHFQPDFGVIMETELWPRLLLTCQRRGIPVMLANARLSERSARRYARFPALTRLTLGALASIGAQTAADAARFRALGAGSVTITGNIKFDIAPPASAQALGAELRARIGPRAVLLAASTREGEEALLLDAWTRLGAGRTGDVLLVLVPRHPQRFDEVAALVRAHDLSLQRRSDPAAVAASTRVWLGDSMGEMFAYYATADVALIGGSWLPLGGQNLIEACASGTPVIIGPHTFNFLQVAEQAVAAGAARREVDVGAGLAAALKLLHEPDARAAMAAAGREFAAAHRGATARTVALLAELTASAAR